MVEVDHYLGPFIGGKGFGPLYFVYKLIQNATPLKTVTTQVLKVGQNVYVAIGYGLANSIMLEGEEGVVIIDTLESCEVAKEVRAAFEEVRL